MLKVNGGIFKDQVNTGSLRAFVISGLTSTQAEGHNKGLTTALDVFTATTDGEEWLMPTGEVVVYDAGTPVPNTLAEMVYRILSTRGTVVSIEAVAGELHVIMENSTAWGFDRAGKVSVDAMDSLEAELQKLVTDAVACSSLADPDRVVTDVDLNTITGTASAVEVRLVFDTTAGALVDTDKVNVHGGNAHDQGEV